MLRSVWGSRLSQDRSRWDIVAEVSGRPWTGVLRPMQVRPREHNPQENGPRCHPGVCLGHPKRLLKTVSWGTFRQMKNPGRNLGGGAGDGGSPRSQRTYEPSF